ncbi:MAG: histidine phosphatase family protein [Gammaproteobacteria bacterium]
MKTICLIRHAKSSWQNHVEQDKDRPLDPRGVEDAIHLGAYLKEQTFQPDAIISSDATRALTTSQYIAQAMGLDDNKVVIESKIYEAGVEALLKVIQGLSNDFDSVILVGHNPGLSWLANYLADGHQVNLPTCGSYCITFETNNWADIMLVEGNVIFSDSPKHNND